METHYLFDDTYRDLATRLSEDCLPVQAPRGERVRELLAVQFAVLEPRTRALTSKARAFNRGFAAGEFCWYLRGAADLASVAYYSKRMPRWSDDGQTMAGAYGPRVFGAVVQTCRFCGYARTVEWTAEESARVAQDRHPDKEHDWWPPDGAPEVKSQWALAREELLRDLDSRRAVVAVYNRCDAFRAARGTKDVPCTLSLQFLVRRSKSRRDAEGARQLHLVATMRSCDFVWGLANDVFSFTMLQETMAVELREAGLDVELGKYVHQAASLHVYECHWDLVERVAAEPPPLHSSMPPLAARADLDALLRDEEALRAGVRASPGPYGGAAEWLRLALEEHRAKRDAEGVRDAEESCAACVTP